MPISQLISVIPLCIFLPDGLIQFALRFVHILVRADAERAMLIVMFKCAAATCLSGHMPITTEGATRVTVPRLKECPLNNLLVQPLPVQRIYLL